ncbi:hypothetical protein C8R47DRAFT_303868 [Mycena vitilis]|nr:hypothetical protein C8R47DRAFT_303868 [Mycena vitilis]
MSRNSKRTPAFTASAQDQCVQNPDLLERILQKLIVPHATSTPRELRSARKTLYSAALTSRSVYPSAVKILWRRLHNLGPLIRLLPTVPASDGVYYWPGHEDADWEVFDRHAAYVREISYSTSPIVPVNPLVYMRLSMRKSILLPKLSRFSCLYDAPGMELLLYVSPSLVSVALASVSAPDTETFLNMLSRHAPALSRLTLKRIPNSSITYCGLFRDLQSIDLSFLEGPVTYEAIQILGSLPLLHSFTTDFNGWDEFDLDMIPPASIFVALTHLTVTATPDVLGHTVPLFLSRIAAPSMVAITILKAVRWMSSNVRPVPAGTLAKTFLAISQSVATRWSTSLQNLRIHFLDSSCKAADLSAIQGLTSIRTLELTQTLHGSLGDEKILATVRTWSELTSLTIDCAVADIEFMKCLAQHCPMLRTLHVAFLPHRLPDVSTTPIRPHSLVELRFFALDAMERRWQGVDTHLLARHLDRLFPEVKSIQGDEESSYEWGQVAKLVFMCQDVRRAALEQR